MPCSLLNLSNILYRTEKIRQAERFAIMIKEAEELNEIFSSSISVTIKFIKNLTKIYP